MPAITPAGRVAAATGRYFQGVENGGIIPGVSVSMRVLDRISAFKRSFHSRNRLVGVAENPKHPGHKHQHGHACPPVVRRLFPRGNQR